MLGADEVCETPADLLNSLDRSLLGRVLGETAE
jgi:hypothetical protein